MSTKEPLGSKESIMRGTIERMPNQGGVRPHEMDRAVKIAAKNWTGRTTAGEAARSAVNAITEGA